MAIAEFSHTADFGRPAAGVWLLRHGFAVALAGCLAFWSLVAVTLYVAL